MRSAILFNHIIYMYIIYHYYNLSDQGEVIEAPWEPVLLGADQEIANLNDGDATREVIHLAVKRRKTTKKRDHITKVSVCRF